MTLLNVSISAERVLLAVDTEAQYPFGLYAHSSKVAAYPHANCVIAMRGTAGVCHALHRLLSEGAGGEDFDEIDERMPALLGSVMAARGLLRSVFFVGRLFGMKAEQFASQDVVLAGWSERRGRAWARQYEHRSFLEGFVGSDIHEFAISPWYPSWEDTIAPIGTPTDAKSMTALALEQVRLARRDHPATACGGRLILATIERKAISLQEIAELPTHIPAAAAAAPSCPGLSERVTGQGGASSAV